MTKIRRTFIWFWMLGKRLLKQWSFVVLLCLIPVLVPAVNMAMSEDSGLVHILLCQEGDDATAKQIISSLTEQDTLARFTIVDSADLATKQVANHKADLAWIFPKDFSQKLDNYAGNRSREPILTVVQRESNMTTRIANEMLYSAIYPDFSYQIYRNFSKDNVVNRHNVSEELLREEFDKMQLEDNIVITEKISLDGALNTIEVTYLNAPVRGLLSIMVLLCTLTAAMYALRDRAQGRFDWLSPQKRIVPVLGSCLAAAILSGIVMLISLAVSNMAGILWIELVALLLLIITTTAFALLVSLPFHSYGKFGAVIPGILIAALALSPIFFNLGVETYLPSYYYLMSIYYMKYHLIALGYAAVLFILIFIGNYFLSKRKKRNTVI